MSTILKTKSLYFNDVNLIIKGEGVVKSRKDIPRSLERVIVSPMVSVIGPTFVKEAAQLGLSIACPRFMTMSEKIGLCNVFNNYKKNDLQKFFMAFGLSEKISDLEAFNRAEYSIEKNILFDIADGYIPQLKSSVDRVRDYIGNFKSMMVGNVMSGEGVQLLEEKFKSYCYGEELFIRVGIGNGGPCETSDETGVNRGQITELIECSEAVRLEKTKLVSDGGISKPGYACKAWGAGADCVLMGSYFSKAKEAEAHISGDGTYFGCASEKQNKLAGLDKHSEGKEIKIQGELKPLRDLVKQFWGGVSSSISMLSHTSLESFIGNGVFEEKSNSLPPKKRALSIQEIENNKLMQPDPKYTNLNYCIAYD